MKLSRWIFASALTVIAGLLLSTPAYAQGGDMGSRLEQELQRTEEIIQRAMELVRDAGNAQAGLLVKKAIELQAEAHNSFRNGRWAICANQTKLARELAQRAMGLLQRPEERLERVELELERTDEMIQAAREKGSPDWPETALALMAGVQRQQEKAWEFYRATQLRPALRLTLQVREMLRKLDHQMSGTDPRDMRARIEQVSDLVGRAFREAEESGQTHRIQLSERAREILMRARERLADGRLRAAHQHLEQAERLANQALRLENRERGPEEFEADMGRYEARLEQLQLRLVDYPSREATRLVEESMEHHRLAREQATAEDGTLERAMAELRIAMRLLERAGELVQ